MYNQEIKEPHLFNKKPILLFIYILCLVPGFSNSLYAVQDSSKTALVLSGGGARGLGHIGVLKALDEAGIQPDVIVGTSMGAIIGGLYACGIPVDSIEEEIYHIDYNSILSNQSYKGIELASQKLVDFPALMRIDIDKNLNLNFPKYLFTAQTIQDRLMPLTIAAQHRSNGEFDSLAIPLRIVATDIKSGKAVIFKQGNIARLMAASSAMPFLFSPVEQDSMNLVDGGLTNNVPCDIAQNYGADFIITSDLTSRKANIHNDATPSRYFEQTINTLAYLSDTRNLHLSDVYIRPRVDNISSNDFSKIDTLIKASYKEAKQKIADIPGQIKRNPDSRVSWYKEAKTRLDSTYISQVRLVKQKNIKSYIIRRENRLKKKDRWDLKKAQQSIGNLYSTKLFKSVSLSLQQYQDSTELIYELNPRPKSRISFGAFYDNEINAKAFLSLEYRNLLESSINYQLYIITSQRYKKLAWDVNMPRIFTTNFTNYISAYMQEEKIPFYNYSESGSYWTRGLNLNFGLNISRGGLALAGVKFENVHVRESPNLSFIKKKKYSTLRLSGQIFVDSRNRNDMPTEGKLTRVVYEQSLKNDLDPLKSFAKISFETIDYQKMAGEMIFSTHFNGGFMNKAMSYFERFRLGGVNSFPGYRKDALWGKLYLNIGLAVRYPVSEVFFLRSKVLAGNIWDNINQVEWNVLRTGARFGFLIPTPLGPLSLDYGMTGKNKPILYFSFGHRF